jgi:hypothetical protein
MSAKGTKSATSGKRPGKSTKTAATSSSTRAKRMAPARVSAPGAKVTYAKQLKAYIVVEQKKTTGRLRDARADEPSKDSLEEIPPVDFGKAHVFGRGPEGLKKGLEWLRRGRPKKGQVAEGTSTRSLRLPDRAWEELDRIAKERGITTHALVREALAKLVLRT